MHFTLKNIAIALVALVATSSNLVYGQADPNSCSAAKAALTKCNTPAAPAAAPRAHRRTPTVVRPRTTNQESVPSIPTPQPITVRIEMPAAPTVAPAQDNHQMDALTSVLAQTAQANARALELQAEANKMKAETDRERLHTVEVVDATNRTELMHAQARFLDKKRQLAPWELAVQAAGVALNPWAAHLGRTEISESMNQGSVSNSNSNANSQTQNNNQTQTSNQSLSNASTNNNTNTTTANGGQGATTGTINVAGARIAPGAVNVAGASIAPGAVTVTAAGGAGGSANSAGSPVNMSNIGNSPSSSSAAANPVATSSANPTSSASSTAAANPTATSDASASAAATPGPGGSI